MNSNKNQSLLLAYFCLAAVCVIWGTTYLALRVGVTHFPPFLFSFLRFVSAGPILIGLVMWFGKASLPTKENVIHQFIGGFLMVTLGISVVGWAEVNVSSGLAAIICSMIPIWIIVINIIAGKQERPTVTVVLGLLLGLTGIVMIFGEHLGEFSNAAYTVGIIVIFLSNTCWAMGTVWMKRKNQNSDPFLNAGLQMFFGSLVLIPLSLIFDDYNGIHWSGEVISSLVYLILIGSVAGFACYSYAIKKLPTTLVSLYAYVNPIVAVVLGWLVLDEKLNLRIGAAILITLAGIYIVNRGYQASGAGSGKNMLRKQSLKHQTETV
jgi:drug/metabolite transporter (DMT)-like permease